MPLQKQKHRLPMKAPVVERPSFGQVIKEGLAFGVGQSIAHRVVGSVFGPTAPTVPTAPTAPNQKTESFNYAYVQCLKESMNDEKACIHLL